MSRIYNFSAGPAILPEEVLVEAQAQLVDYQGSGMSIMEMSHRGKEYMAVQAEAEANIKKLLAIPDDYAVLFLTGGASGQFAMIPMNLLGADQTADYTHSGSWASKAIKEAKLFGKVNLAADVSKEKPARMPDAAELKWTEGAVYAHITSNETIEGTQWKHFPKTAAPLVADMSSDILSRPFDVSPFGLIYAGAQKNIGPAGVTLVIIRKDLAEKVSDNVPVIFRYKTHMENESMYNTPPCFPIYIVMLVTRWLLKNGGLAAMQALNERKAGALYQAIDATEFYRGTAAPGSRSTMNVTFRLPSEELEEKFIKEASALGLKGLKGHRSVGGIRASIYNAFPAAGVDTLVAFMKEFEKKNG
ncbi:MAG TPA: 3-phosphoserine/phosphohydroxythreonine transaminase [Kiritimatiellia bacterium]|nr:3-phosphoserine/phosphohydroxythreonine transaminase [Kiritimatiellia bacterium]HMP00257.1 3-phosphoserine/phosphohydroxythreonine transaminase [Kiritimatiellia bacterium]HMP97515.1 3-phosphoserine/phosphohydroxythreonine transaminase [Kiritimatiellia bacterium]